MRVKALFEQQKQYLDSFAMKFENTQLTDEKATPSVCNFSFAVSFDFWKFRVTFLMSFFKTFSHTWKAMKLSVVR